jgi:hypothetical protein
MRRNLTWAITVLAGLCLVFSPRSSEGAAKPIAKYRGEIPSTGSGPSFVFVTIRSWTSDADAKALGATLKTQGVDATKKAIEKLNLGYIAVVGSFGWPINVAKTYPGPNGGQRIVVVTDRPIGFAEAEVSGASMDYPFGLVELNVDASGNGSGTIIGMCRITIDPATGKIDVEPFRTGSNSLVNVRLEK